jgi:hypothetical protein
MKTKRWEVIMAEDDKEDVMIFELAAAEANLAIHLRHAENGDLFVHPAGTGHSGYSFFGYQYALQGWAYLYHRNKKQSGLQQPARGDVYFL